VKTKTLIMFAVVLLLGTAALACPLCKDSVGNSGLSSPTPADGGASLSAGFNGSVYVMLIGLFAVMGLVGFNLSRAIRGK